MRQPTCAGTLYPATETELRASIEACYTGDHGPSALPTRTLERHVTAAIVPHDEYALSGPAAAWVYHALALSPRPELVIILGTNHVAAESGTSTESWQTPLGLVRVDQTFVKAVAAKGTITLRDEVVQHDTSIEPQLPFLQHLYKDATLRIAPFIVARDVDAQKLALDLKEALLETNQEALVIASSNLTHHGPKHKHVRFSQNAAEQIALLDKQLLELIERHDPAAWLDFIDKELPSVCGADAIATLLALTRGTMKLEQYYTSSDVSGDVKNSVSYAGIIFE